MPVSVIHTVTHVSRLECYLCVRTVPTRAPTRHSSRRLCRRSAPPEPRLSLVVRAHCRTWTLPSRQPKPMSLVDTLLTNAYKDTQLLIKNDSLGDVFSKSREVEFLLRTPDEKKADLVCSFVNDNEYGKAVVQRSDTDFGILITINMPATQNLICSVSALMCCLAPCFQWSTTVGALLSNVSPNPSQSRERPQAGFTQLRPPLTSDVMPINKRESCA